MAVYVTGDLHGDIRRLFRQCIPQSASWTAEDTLIVCGDFGMLFFQDERDTRKLDWIATLPYTVAFLDGNHEAFPAIYGYPVENWNGGKVHRIRRNIVHLMRGQVFTIEGHTYFTMGGGYSLDKAMRREGLSWWPEEMPTREEYDEGLRNLAAHGGKVDFILSHAAPWETMLRLKHLGRFSHLSTEEQPLSTYLETVRSMTEHRHWYFGHLHLDEEMWRNQTALYSTVIDPVNEKTIFELPD